MDDPTVEPISTRQGGHMAQQASASEQGQDKSENRDPDGTAKAIYCLLIDTGHPWPWSAHEIELEIGNRIEVENSLARLRGLGLVHRLGEFVWPTRTALATEALTL